MPSSAISAQGTTLGISDDGTAFTDIGEIKSYSGFDGQSTELDVTNLQSTAKEYRLGLKDSGNLQIDLNIVKDDPGQLALQDALDAGSVKQFELTLPDGGTMDFAGLVKQFSQQGGVDAIQTGTAQIRITGDVTYAAAVV